MGWVGGGAVWASFTVNTLRPAPKNNLYLYMYLFAWNPVAGDFRTTEFLIVFCALHFPWRTSICAINVI